MTNCLLGTDWEVAPIPGHSNSLPRALASKSHYDHREHERGENKNKGQQTADKPRSLPLLFWGGLGNSKEVDESIRNEVKKSHRVQAPALILQDADKRFLFFNL